jgi:uncharacterized protein YceH (UPF0502 family)
VTKYEHRLQEVFNFDRRETAVICVLLLRGPQTPGELRGRTERMYRFEALEDVQSAIQKLMDRQPPLARVLPRQPGTKESRYMHLLSGDTAPEYVQAIASASPRSSSNDAQERISNLENELALLRSEIAQLRRELADFKQQF